MLGPVVRIIVPVLLLASSLRAESADEAALRRIDSGVDAYRAGDYATARREFEAARRLVPDKANPYRWLGLTEAQLGDCTAALLDFAMFLKLVPANDERVPEVIRLRNQCERVSPPVPASLPPPVAERHKTAPPRRWWIWTTIAGAAVVAGTAIALGVVLGTPREGRFAPIVCAPAGCSPGSM